MFCDVRDEGTGGMVGGEDNVGGRSGNGGGCSERGGGSGVLEKTRLDCDKLLNLLGVSGVSLLELCLTLCEVNFRGGSGGAGPDCDRSDGPDWYGSGAWFGLSLLYPACKKNETNI